MNKTLLRRTPGPAGLALAWLWAWTRRQRGAVLAIALLLLALGVPQALRAMTVEVHGNRVFATGGLLPEDYPKFRDAFNQPGIDTVVFVNAPGGDLYTAMTIGRLIAARGFKTVAAGSCMSACSIMFVGGRERQFADAFRPNLTVIGIHGAHGRVSKRIDPAWQPQIFAFYKARLGEAFDAALINRALYEMDDAGAFLRVPDNIRNPRAKVFHCRSALSLRRDCTEFDGKDASSLGLITTRTLASIELPDNFRVKSRLFGRDLIDSLLSTPEYVVDFVNQICRSERCKQGVTDWAARPDHRALAMRRGEVSLAANWNRDSPNIAFINAVYACNHLRGQPVALCEARVVNNTDVRFIYEEAETGQREALATLQAPPEKYYANEQLGGPAAPATSLRAQRLQDITPLRVEGVRTVNTQELASLLTSATPPAVIDVWAGALNVIPGAETLLYGGNAFDDPKREADYNQRFLALLELLVKDKNRPVVFYAKGRDNWFGVNAALRARAAGYVDVSWYRGGYDSWSAARLPVAPIAIRAVAN